MKCQARRFGYNSSSPGNTVEILLQAEGGLGDPPTVVADSGVENVNSKVEELIESGTLPVFLTPRSKDRLPTSDTSRRATPCLEL